jgi:hypothetical protein
VEDTVDTLMIENTCLRVHSSYTVFTTEKTQPREQIRIPTVKKKSPIDDPEAVNGPESDRQALGGTGVQLVPHFWADGCDALHLIETHTTVGANRHDSRCPWEAD